MIKVLSTKKLPEIYQNEIRETGASYEEYSAIEIEHLNFDWPISHNKLIFTSQNSVHAFLNKRKELKTKYRDISCFCVGEKTMTLLESNNLKVQECCDNSRSLGNTIVKKYPNYSFLYLCGNIRREELPLLLKSNSIELRELEVYKTKYNIISFENSFDAVLFYSPSGVISYLENNDLKNSVAFCLGKTTAQEAIKKAAKTIVPGKPSIKNLIMEFKSYSKNTITGK